MKRPQRGRSKVGWHPAGMRYLETANRGFRCAQPPANCWQPSGLIFGINLPELSSYFSDSQASISLRTRRLWSLELVVNAFDAAVEEFAAAVAAFAVEAFEFFVGR